MLFFDQGGPAWHSWIRFATLPARGSPGSAPATLPTRGSPGSAPATLPTVVWHLPGLRCMLTTRYPWDFQLSNIAPAPRSHTGLGDDSPVHTDGGIPWCRPIHRSHSQRVASCPAFL